MTVCATCPFLRDIWGDTDWRALTSSGGYGLIEQTEETP